MMERAASSPSAVVCSPPVGIDVHGWAAELEAAFLNTFEARWQLAGDEFAPGDPLALMATGFLGAGVFPTQITANEVERTRYDALDDSLLAHFGERYLRLTGNSHRQELLRTRLARLGDGPS